MMHYTRSPMVKEIWICTGKMAQRFLRRCPDAQCSSEKYGTEWRYKSSPWAIKNRYVANWAPIYHLAGYLVLIKNIFWRVASPALTANIPSLLFIIHASAGPRYFHYRILDQLCQRTWRPEQGRVDHYPPRHRRVERPSPRPQGQGHGCRSVFGYF